MWSSDTLSKIKVPFFSHLISRSDKNAIINALNSNLLTDGPILRKFEAEFAKFTDSNYAVGTSNATTSLHLALKSIGIKKGDEVIVPNITFIATANAVLQAGATPILADVEYDTMNISGHEILKKITSRTRAVIPVHFAGRPCNMDEIVEIGRKRDLKIIEDCAHAIGTKYRDKHVGNFGEIGCFSFYPTKNITTIEGGMIITNSKKIAEYIRTSRNHGINRNLVQRYSKGKPWEYDVRDFGYNFRLDEIRASLGISQLKRIDEINKRRKQIYDFYNKYLVDIKGMILPSEYNVETNSYHLYVIKITKQCKKTRDQVYRELLRHGIQTTVHYKPLNYFTMFKKNGKDRFDISRILYRQILSLPFYPSMSETQLNHVVKSLHKILS